MDDDLLDTEAKRAVFWVEDVVPRMDRLMAEMTATFIVSGLLDQGQRLVWSVDHL